MCTCWLLPLTEHNYTNTCFLTRRLVPNLLNGLGGGSKYLQATSQSKIVLVPIIVQLGTIVLDGASLGCGSNAPHIQETSNTCPITSIMPPSGGEWYKYKCKHTSSYFYRFRSDTNTNTYYAPIMLLCMGVKTSILHCKTKQSQSNNSLKLSKSELLDAVKKLERLGTCATICWFGPWYNQTGNAEPDGTKALTCKSPLNYVTELI